MTPFERYAADHGLLFKMICKGHFKMSRRIDAAGAGAQIIRSALTVDPMQRIGSFAGGITDIKNHEWFLSVDFYKLNQKKYRTPWVPPAKDYLSEADGKKFSGSERPEKPLKPDEEAQFSGFAEIQSQLHDRGVAPEERRNSSSLLNIQRDGLTKDLSGFFVN
uniref:AGC-kinase C-terminal domain-containing protein n=1 Tax=Entomoneis paludosa TaxID=265537 RepID=A0A7S2YF55_9STRA|mmetsp:Transcript_30267/g.63230  ORF Transcript_30267/g.63230 Transcript_30267/m.63230 type:complete len:163 (+) Transcript_30267:2-490(+)